MLRRLIRPSLFREAEAPRDLSKDSLYQSYRTKKQVGGSLMNHWTITRVELDVAQSHNLMYTTQWLHEGSRIDARKVIHSNVLLSPVPTHSVSLVISSNDLTEVHLPPRKPEAASRLQVENPVSWMPHACVFFVDPGVGIIEPYDQTVAVPFTEALICNPANMSASLPYG